MFHICVQTVTERAECVFVKRLELATLINVTPIII